MNIWLCFVPGSAATSMEMILRSDCTDLVTLPINRFWGSENKFVTAHGNFKQWHPGTKDELLNPKYKKVKDNVFTPVIPMSDMMGHEMLKYISTQEGINFI